MPKLSSVFEKVSSSKQLKLLQTLGSYQLRPKGQTKALLACPDGKTFWSASGQLILWDSRTGSPLRSVEFHASSIALYKNTLLALASHGLFSLVGGKLLELHKPSGGQCHCATFSQDGAAALVSGSFGCRVWNADGSKQRGNIKNAGYQQERISPDGKNILFYSRGLRLATVAERELWRNDDAIEAAIFLNDDMIIGSTRSGELCMIDAESGERTWSKKLSERPLHEAVVRPVGGRPRVAYQGSLWDGFPASAEDGGGRMASIVVDDGETIYLLNLAGELLSTIEGNKIVDSRQMALSPLGDWLVVCHNRELLKIYDLPSGQERLSKLGHSSRIQGLEWITPTQVLSVAFSDEYARRWDVSTGETLWLTELSTEYASNMRLLPDRQSFVVERGDQTIEQRDVTTGDLLHQHTASSFYGSWGFSRDGRWLLKAPGKHSYKAPILLAFEQQQETPAWTVSDAYRETVNSFFFSHDNQFVWAFSDGSARRYELTTGRETLRYIPPYGEEYSGVQLLRDGVTAVGGISVLDESGYYPDSFLRRWNLETNKIEWSVSQDASSLYVSQEEEWLLMRAYQKIQLRWLSSGELIDELDLSPLNDYITATSLSSDETKLAIGTDRGVILIYELTAASAPVRHSSA